MLDQKVRIVISLQVEGLHQWEGVVEAAKVDPELVDVLYLQYPHRHIFHIKIEKTVRHGDRDVEIILFKNRVTRYLIEKYSYHDNDRDILMLGNKSCEMIASELAEEFSCYKVEVLEDNENGASVTRPQYA